ncbi:MAG: hypothetical protein GC186_17620 [Rhodobacteraceae bacterium]|nr:hypothetical protein [Paracoccaceae bacterium]
MTRIAFCLALLLAAPAGAQTVFDRAVGLYGSAVNPAESCTQNPHRLDFMAAPPHALFHWAHPAPDASGQMRDRERYDILDYDDGSITLRREGDPQVTADGHLPIWILRLTSTPAGYCWGRTDWPSVRCERQAVRCGDDAPTS